MANNGIHRYLGTLEVGRAKTDKEAPNLGQVKELINRYNKEPARVATTGELNGSVVDGVMTLTTDLNTIDGVTMQLNDSVLVKDEINKKNNGVYVITKLGTVSTPSNASASTTSSTITSVSVNKNTFETKTSANTDKTYTYTYDGVTDNEWKDESSIVVDLTEYGISLEGSPTDGDTISVVYTAIIAGQGGELTLRDDWKIGNTILNNTFINVMEGNTNQDTRFTVCSDGVLVVGTNDIIFIKDIDTEQSNLKVVKSEIIGDGSTKIFNASHNFNLSDEYAYILKIIDNNGNEVFVNNEPKSGDEKNAITLNFDIAPEITDVFKVYILGIQ